MDAPSPVDPAPTASDAAATVETMEAVLAAITVTSPAATASPSANSATVFERIWLEARAPAPLTARPVDPPMARPSVAAAEIALMVLRLTSSRVGSASDNRRR